MTTASFYHPGDLQMVLYLWSGCTTFGQIGFAIGLLLHVSVFIRMWRGGRERPRIKEHARWLRKINALVFFWAMFVFGYQMTLLTCYVAQANSSLEDKRLQWWINFQWAFAPIAVGFLIVVVGQALAMVSEARIEKGAQPHNGADRGGHPN